MFDIVLKAPAEMLLIGPCVAARRHAEMRLLLISCQLFSAIFMKVAQNV